MKHARRLAPGLWLLFAVASAGAQEPRPDVVGPILIQRGGVQPPPTVFLPDSQDARATREQLQQILRQLPPAVGEVLRRDPSLLTREGYLDPYPALIAFLQQHPEIARNPAFFLGNFEYFAQDPQDLARRRAENMFVGVLASLGIAAGAVALLSVFVWLVRAIIEHRRWLRASRVQAEVHTKVMDRLTSNEDLLAYIQTPTGRRFLEAGPVADGAPRRPGAPLTSILWSLQGGVVLIALGVGMWFLQGRVMQEIAEGIFVIAVIAASLGIGFVASAVLAYVLSSRLGLVDTPKTDHA